MLPEVCKMWFLEKWLENPKTVKKMNNIFYISLVISCLLGFVVHYGIAPSENGEHGEEEEGLIWEKIPVFSAIYGFISCALIIILSKAYGHAGIMVEEDYYDK